jgi:autotransporter-associated beta strand protein
MYPLFTKAPCTALHHNVRFTPASSHSYPRLVRKTFLQTVLAVAISFLAPVVAHAGSATWDLNPGSGDWNAAANWTPMTVPNGPGDIATFGLSNTTSISISANTEVNAVTFTTGNSGYTVTVNPTLTLTVSGAGIIGAADFVEAEDFMGNWGTIVFSNRATAGLSYFSTGNFEGGLIVFKDRSTADNAFIDSSSGGQSLFFNSSTAGNATIFQNVGGTFFSDRSTAGNATIHLHVFSGLEFSGSSNAANANIDMLEDTDFVEFSDAATAGNASLAGLAGGYIRFSGFSKGGTARIGLGSFASNHLGVLDIGFHNAPGVTIGSIEGDAIFPSAFVSLGANNLTIGSNNLSTTFSGVIEDNGFGGSLTKIGTGTLDLMGENTYTGLTNINGGVLQVDGSISSNTFVNHKGALAGGGTVYGNVTNYAGEVSPGDPLGVPGVLTVSNNYMQTPSATLTVQIAGTDPDQVSVLNVLGNANLNGALDPELLNGFVPAIGQSFTILDYASVTGSFSHIKNPVFDHGTKRWSLVYGPNSAYLVVVRNGRGQLSEVLGNYR